MQINNIAKRTIEKIEKAEQKRDALIAKRDEFQKATDAKIAEMNEGIKEVDKELAKLREQEKTEKLAAIGSALSKKGVDVNTLLAAVANNDLYTIQDILEGNSAPAPEPATEQIEQVEAVAENVENEEVVETADNAENNENTENNENAENYNNFNNVWQ